MIIYSNRTSACNPSQRLRSLRAADALTLLLEVGAMESAVADQCPALTPSFSDSLQHIAEAWLLRRSPPCVQNLVSLPLPPALRLSRPEGFCDYAVTPESYARAAQSFYQAKRPADVVVVGIRTIGSTLSAVVAAVLQARGCHVSRFTVRPHGHPYHREVSLPESFTPGDGVWYLVVDEGPGRSGSSFASVATALTGAGVPSRRVVFLPANDPDPDTLCSEEGRRAWRTYSKVQATYTAPPFLQDAAGFTEGRRRKYIRHERPIRRVAKFAGVGPFGLTKLHLAQQLADAGFTPKPQCLHDGFLITDWIDAPAQPPVTAAFLDHLARYLAFRAALPAPAPGHTFEDLLEMVEVNYTEAGLIPPHLATCRSLIVDQPPACIDGRLTPDKWLSDGTGFAKLDAVDHYDDHFYPGPQEIAWDLAGATEELNLDARAAEHLLEAFAEQRPSEHLRGRVAFFVPVYRAYRMGLTMS